MSIMLVSTVCAKACPIQGPFDFCIIFSHSNNKCFQVRRMFLKASITNTTVFSHNLLLHATFKAYNAKIHMECILISIIHLAILQPLCDYLINATFTLYDAIKEAQKCSLIQWELDDRNTSGCHHFSHN